MDCIIPFGGVKTTSSLQGQGIKGHKDPLAENKTVI
jgi:hypothetical protein